jgi:hypothetical protein
MPNLETQWSEQIALYEEMIAKLRHSEHEMQNGRFDALDSLVTSLAVFSAKLDVTALPTSLPRADPAGSLPPLVAQAKAMLAEILQLSRNNESLIRDYLQSLSRQLDDAQKGRQLIKSLRDCTHALPRALNSKT